MFKLLLGALLLFISCESRGQSHSYLNYMRSSTGTKVFIQQNLNGEYGEYDTTEKRKFWKGYGIGTSLGLETMKFVQFMVGHTLVNLKNKDAESLQGSRIYGGGRLSFLSPVGNLEIGGGAQGSRLDYQNKLDTGSFYGSGLYWSLGVNYFMTSQVSVYAEATETREHMVRGSGEGKETMNGDSTLMGLGFRVYL